MKRTPQNICPHCDAGDPTSVITECNCEDPTPAPLPIIPVAPVLDIGVRNEGTIVMVWPITPRARSWIHEHVDVPEWAWMGPRFAVEPRLVDDLLNGARDAGLTIANGF